MRIKCLKNGALLLHKNVHVATGATVLDDVDIREEGEGDEVNYAAVKSLFVSCAPSVSGDADAAIGLHGLLPLSRREAANTEFWAYIAMIECPQYVNSRFGDADKNKFPVPSRFVGPWWDNAISRLWWLAELTVQRSSNDPYFLTRQVGSDSELYQQVLDLSLSCNIDVVKMLASRVFPQNAPKLNGDQIKSLAKRCNAARATHLMDILPEREIVESFRYIMP